MAKVKICGLNSTVAVRHAISAGADYVGLVHFAKSPRHVGLKDAAALAQVAREAGRARSVVLLVDPNEELVLDVAAKVDPDLIQLHGTETAERVAGLRAVAGRPIIKAVAVATREDVAQAAAAYLGQGCADHILFDAKPPAGAELPGGNGLAFDWTILSERTAGGEFWLAGGLTPDNVADAVRLTQPATVDVSSGVECAPGQKDPDLVTRFIAAARTAGGSGR